MFDLRERTILLVIAGSRSYGLHTPESDVDIKGICIPPINEYKLGILDSFEQADSPQHLATFMNVLNKEEQEATIKDCQNKNLTAPDGSVYDISKFFSLALNANPNILEALYCNEEDIRIITLAGQKIRDNRDIFLSQKVMWSYQGYAFSQMKRIKTHRSWLLNPPTKEPTREGFGLPATRSLLTGDEQNAFLWVLAEILKDKVGEFRLTKSTKEELEDKLDVFGAIQAGIPDNVWPTIQEITGATSEFIQVMQAERKYKSALNHWNSYLNWKSTRNPKRAALEKKCQYDSKHAMHLARLMKQGRAIIETGTLPVRVPLETKEWLMWIREGNMNFNDLETWFEKEQNELKIAATKSSLPKSPNRKKANKLLIELQIDTFR